jgi:hypothetical protein
MQSEIIKIAKRYGLLAIISLLFLIMGHAYSLTLPYGLNLYADLVWMAFFFGILLVSVWTTIQVRGLEKRLKK